MLSDQSPASLEDLANSSRRETLIAGDHRRRERASHRPEGHRREEHRPDEQTDRREVGSGRNRRLEPELRDPESCDEDHDDSYLESPEEAVAPRPVGRNGVPGPPTPAPGPALALQVLPGGRRIRHGLEVASGSWRPTAVVLPLAASCQSEPDELGTRGDTELDEHMVEMPFDSAGADAQAGGDRLVGQSLRDQVDDLLLSPGERRERPSVLRGPELRCSRPRVAVTAESSTVVAERRPDGPHELVARHRLEQVAGDARVDRRAYVVLVVVCREDDDPGRRVAARLSAAPRLFRCGPGAGCR